MSRSCAKPTCSDPAVSWFDLSRVTQAVTRSATPTDLGIALCRSHADRFTVPEGWTLIEAAGHADQPELPQAEVGDESAPAQTRRAHDRDNPWFVDAATVDAAEGIQGGEHTVNPVHGPAEGSLLHRAFNGPTTPDATIGDDDIDRPAAPVDELSPRRRARSSSDDAEEEAVGGYHEFELPFPPHGARVHQVAVS